MTIYTYTQLFPNVAWGQIHGETFYFRARHEQWQLHIKEKVCTSLEEAEATVDRFVLEGEAEYAGGWDEEETRQQVMSALRRYQTRE